MLNGSMLVKLSNNCSTNSKSYLLKHVISIDKSGAGFSTTSVVLRGNKKKGQRRGFEDPNSIADTAQGWEQKLNFGNLQFYNKRHLPEHKKLISGKFQHNLGKYGPVHTYGCRGTGIRHEGAWEKIPEMVPDIGINGSKVTMLCKNMEFYFDVRQIGIVLVKIIQYPIRFGF